MLAGLLQMCPALFEALLSGFLWARQHFRAGMILVSHAHPRPANTVLQFVARTNMSFQQPGWYSNVAGLSASSFMQQLLQLTSIVAHTQNPTGTALSPENKLHAWLKQKYDRFCHALEGLLQAPNNNLQVCFPTQSCVAVHCLLKQTTKVLSPRIILWGFAPKCCTESLQRFAPADTSAALLVRFSGMYNAKRLHQIFITCTTAA